MTLTHVFAVLIAGLPSLLLCATMLSFFHFSGKDHSTEYIMEKRRQNSIYASTNPDNLCGKDLH